MKNKERDKKREKIQLRKIISQRKVERQIWRKETSCVVWG